MYGLLFLVFEFELFLKYNFFKDKYTKGKFVLFNDASRAYWFSYHRLLDVKHMVIATDKYTRLSIINYRSPGCARPYRALMQTRFGKGAFLFCTYTCGAPGGEVKTWPEPISAPAEHKTDYYLKPHSPMKASKEQKLAF